MTIYPGVDYAWSHPGGSALKKAGVIFACRYSSNDPNKDISRAEADDLADHGVWTVIVRETTANRARAGRAAGAADARAAVARATAAGMPADRPLYFAIDYDAPLSDRAAICEYFRGVASVIGLARTGGYGGYDQLKWLIDAELVTWVWQTAAWSRKRLLPGRHIYQYAHTVTLGGVSCDVNEALTSDFGQWMPGRTPQVPKQEKESDVDLNDKVTIPVSPWNDKPVTDTVGRLIGFTNLKADATHQVATRTLAATVANTAAITALARAIGDVHDGVDTDELVARLVPAVTTAVDNAVENAVVKVDVSVGDNTTTRES